MEQAHSQSDSVWLFIGYIYELSMQKMRPTIDKWYLMKFWKLCTAKEMVSKESAHGIGETLSQLHMVQGIRSRIYSELKQLSFKKTNNSTENGLWNRTKIS